MHRINIKKCMLVLIVGLILVGIILLSTVKSLKEENYDENMTPAVTEDGTIFSENNNYEYKRLLYYGSFADAIIELSASWSIDMLANSSEEYNADLAFISAVLSGNAYHQEMYSENSNRLGFSDVKFENYKNPSILKPAVAMSYTSQIINGQTSNIFLIAVRGTADSEDVFTDAYDGVVDKYFLSAENIESQVQKYMCQELQCTQEMLRNQNNIFLIVGHSLGGATANALSVLIEHDELSSKNRIFTYTFESPRTYDKSGIPFSHNGLTELPQNKDASNAFNIINNKDIVPLVPTDASGRYGADVLFDQEYLSDGEFSALSLLSDGKKNVESLKTWTTGVTTFDFHKLDLDLAYLIESGTSQISINGQVSINNTNGNLRYDSSVNAHNSSE